MSRIRSIKPTFFTDAKIFRLERASGLPIRVAYAGLWTLADREGRFTLDADEMKAQILPFDDIDFDQVLACLESGGRIVLYEHHGERYGWIRHFTRHQYINGKEGPSLLPPPPGSEGETSPVLLHEDYAKITREVREDHAKITRETSDETCDDNAPLRKGKERKGIIQLAGELSNDETVGQWIEDHPDRTVRLIAEAALRIPKFKAHFAEFATPEKIEKLVADLRAVSPAEEAITFEIDNWETYNTNGKGQTGASGGAKDMIRALRNWFSPHISRWAVNNRRNPGSGVKRATSPARESVQTAAQRRKDMRRGSGQ